MGAAAVGAKPLEWSVPLFQAMLSDSDASMRRSAVARATYQGVHLRMQQETKASKRAKTEAAREENRPENAPAAAEAKA